MNKKFLSAILFGALMVTSTGTFVSCKDYDEDIDGLQTQVDANKSALSALESQLTSLNSALTAAQSAAAAAQKAADEAKAAAATAKAEAIEEAIAKVEALKELVAEGYATKDEVAAVNAAIAVVSGQIEGIESGLSDLTNYVLGLEEQFNGLSMSALSNIAALQEDLAAQQAALEELKNSTTNEALALQLEEVIEAVKTIDNNYGQSIGFLTNRLDDLEEVLAGKFESQDQFIAQLSQVVGTLVEDVDANATGLEELWAELETQYKPQLGSLASTITAIQADIQTLHVLVARLAGLTFIPEAYVDGVEAILYGSYEYNALTLNQKDSKNENATASSAVYYANPSVIAKYHVSPSNATIDQVKDQLSFAIEANSDFITSRAAASKDFNVTPEFLSLENGILTVKVNVEGAPATAELISVVALQVKGEDDVVVTSDYATIYKQELEDLRIADKKKFAATPKVDYHFRQYINTVDEEAGNDQVVWEHYTDESIDLVFDYKESLDLNEHVGVHVLGEACTIANLEALGMTLEYDIVKNYIIGENKTDQKDFVNLADGVLTAKVFDETGAAAIGRTPIVRVRLMDGNNIVKVAYIKVLISKNVPETENKTFPLVVDDFKFECGEAGVVSTTVEQINKQLYNALDLSKAEFHAMYTFFEDVVAETDLGTVVEKTETIEGETTHILEWTITNEEMWENAGKEVSNVIYYRVAEGSNVYVAVELKSNLEGLKKVYDITKADFIANYWDADKTYTKFNVAVPSSTTDEDPANCTFINNLNSPFVTWPANSTTGIPGILKLDEAVTGIEYFFCADDVATISKIGDIKVKFLVSEDGLTLSASVDGVNYEDIATINNADENWYNVVTYNKESDLAKELLNTGAMYSYIGAKGYVCDDETKPVAITFDGEDHFQANFIRPVNIAEQAADNFIDGVDVGEKGSFIRLEDLIAPYDWRGRYFSEYENYWGYYGPFSIKVLTEEAQCDLNGIMQDVPTTVVLEQSEETVMGDAAKGEQLESEYGFLTYKNNGTNVEEFNVYVKVEVTYGWGVIETGNIKVNVKSTIAAE